MFTRLLLILLVVFFRASDAAPEVRVEATPHAASACSGQFVTHVLDHTTTVNQQPVRLFESNGAGLAINDLDNDGRLDLVFANLDGAETILWNEGGLQFRRENLYIPGRTRAVVILDLDGDGGRDLVFTTQRGTPTLWRNQGDGGFALSVLPGVSRPAYSMNWGDLDLDGDLDLVTGSYDAELAKIMTNSFLFNGGAGVYYYENREGTFHETRLYEHAQALAILFTDLNQDQRWDIAVGNDFTEPDRFWTLQDSQWQELTPFDVITHSTMSFDAADVNNDGLPEFLAADMQPYSDDALTLAAWQPVLDSLLAAPTLDDDPQVLSNTLQTVQSAGYQDLADRYGVDASGWSWSSKFGDLNSDGFPDLYIVNGMIANDLFAHLPNDELVEENQAYINVEGTHFRAAPEWGLNVLDGGRGMSMADLDGDGDLDIVVNNLLTPAQLFENQLCGGSNLTITLHQPGTPNVDAIGAQVTLYTSTGVYRREVRAASGYLSSDAAQLHFGFPKGSQLQSLDIRWPDGATSRLEAVEADTFLKITRE